MRMHPQGEGTFLSPPSEFPLHEHALQPLHMVAFEKERFPWREAGLGWVSPDVANTIPKMNLVPNQAIEIAGLPKLSLPSA